MTTSSLNSNLVHSEESASEIDLVATVVFQPEHFIQSYQLEFASSHDDLDSLIYTSLDLPSGNTICLVRHNNAPYSGTEIHLVPGFSNPSHVLAELMQVLNISPDHLDWVHPLVDLS